MIIVKEMKEGLTWKESKGPIDPNAADAEKLRKTPIPLPAPFAWVELDIDNEDGKDLDDLYELLANNYVEDDDAMFRFGYTKKFLKW
jgi:glycylpeptide N-tetradecanoyltransferase